MNNRDLNIYLQMFFLVLRRSFVNCSWGLPCPLLIVLPLSIYQNCAAKSWQREWSSLEFRLDPIANILARKLLSCKRSFKWTWAGKDLLLVFLQKILCLDHSLWLPFKTDEKKRMLWTKPLPELGLYAPVILMLWSWRQHFLVSH